MSDPATVILAGPPGPALDLLRAALRSNRAALRGVGVDVRPGADPVPEGASRRLIILNAPSPPRLAALRSALVGPYRAVVYVEPPQAALVSRAERALIAGKPLARLLRAPRPIGYRNLLRRYEDAFGPEHLAIRLAAPADLPGDAVIEDFWAAAGLPGNRRILDLSDLRPRRRLSREGAQILDRLLTQHAKHMDPKRNRRAAAAALRSVEAIAGRPFAPPRDYIEAALAASREDIAWLCDRVGEAGFDEPRARADASAAAMDPAALDSIAALVIRAARQSAELRAGIGRKAA